MNYDNDADVVVVRLAWSSVGGVGEFTVPIYKHRMHSRDRD